MAATAAGAATPIADRVLASEAEANIDELDLLAEIEQAIGIGTQSSSNVQPSSQLRTVTGIIDEGSDNEQQQQQTEKKTASSISGRQQQQQRARNTTAAAGSDSPRRRALEIEKARQESAEAAAIAERRLVRSLTFEQQQRYSAHTNTRLSVAPIRRVLQATLNTSKLPAQVPQVLADMCKHAVMVIVERARELQSEDKQRQKDADAAPLNEDRGEVLDKILPYYIKLAYVRLQQEGALPRSTAAPFSRRRLRAGVR